MENDYQSNTNQNNNLINKILSKKYYAILFVVLIIILSLFIIYIFFSIEKFIFKILTLITFLKIISLPLQIILHLLLIRYLVLQVAFAGQNLIISRSVINTLGNAEAIQISKTINSLHDLLSIFIDMRVHVICLKELSQIKKQIENVQSMLNYLLDIFNKMKFKFNKLTIDQEIFVKNINTLNDSINNGILISYINNIANTIKKYNKETIADIPDEEKSKIILELSNKDLNIQNILVACHIIKDQLIDYLGEKYNFWNKRFIRNYFKNDLFGSIEQLHCELDNFYKFEEQYFITKDNYKLEYIIIKKNLQIAKKKLMIICGPNGAPFQIFSRNFRFQNYLEYNMDVLCWNYRGYGFSEGKSTYNKLRSDVLELFDEIKNKYNYEKFAVHGISIGGIPCCHLARNRKEIELLICDRNFGKLDNITQDFSLGKYLYILYKILFFQSTDNVDNYLNSNCYKIILNDTKDNIVLECCSLKTLVSKKLCEKYFGCLPNNNNFVNNITLETYSSNNNNTSELESLSSKKKLINTQNISVSSINDQINSDYNAHNHNNNIKKLENKTVLDKIFNSVEEKKNFVNILIKISNILNKDKLEIKPNKNCITNLCDKCKNKSDEYPNLKEEELQSTNDIFNFVKNHMIDIFDSIESSGDTLLALLTIKRTDYGKAVYIDNFFNNMFIWGCKSYSYGDKNNLHKTKNIKYIFEECMKLFEEFWSSQEIISYKKLPLLKDIEIIYKYFIQIQNNLKYVGLNTKDGFVKLINEELLDTNDSSSDYEKCLANINIGNLVPLNCGHNGLLSMEENEIFDMYLNKSGFLNDKSDEYYKEEKEDNNSDGSDTDVNYTN